MTISAATVRIAGDLTRGAAARYAETPTLSRIDAVDTIDAASLNLKSYIQGWTGAAPVPAMAAERVVTCVASIVLIDLRFKISA